MDETLKEIYLPYRKKLDKLAEKLAVMLSINENEAETLIEDQIATEQTRWLQAEEVSVNQCAMQLIFIQRLTKH